MSDNVLKAIQDSWGFSPVVEEPAEQPGEGAAPATEESYVGFSVYNPDESGSSCEWVGRHLNGTVTTDIDKDVARLIELMRTYPIKPHLHSGGGSGFSHPYEHGWSAEHHDVISEFASLWWTAAGDVIIAKWGKHMEVCPPFDPDNPYSARPRQRPRHPNPPKS